MNIYLIDFILLTLCYFSYGKSITSTAWTQAEVIPIVELNAVWADTLRSITELGNKVEPPPFSYTHDMDDSGLADNQDMVEDGDLNQALTTQADPDSDKENLAPEDELPSPIPLSRNARRQLMQEAYVHLPRL